MSDRVNPQRLRGFRDFLPESMALRKYVIRTFEDIFERYGFLPLETPSLEYAETFEGKSSTEAETLMYKFVDAGGRRVGLRYDLTVPLARVVGMHPDLPMPFKRYHIAPVWRAERPQKGRYREFWQCDVDIVGSDEPAADAEILAIISDCLSAVGFKEYRVLINHRKILSAIARVAGASPEQAVHVYRAIDRLSKVGADGVRQELVQIGLSPDSSNKLIDLINIEGDADTVLSHLERLLADQPEGIQAINELRSILNLLSNYNVNLNSYLVQPSLARGLDYYTGAVFETVVDEPKVGSVTGGGRYDELVGIFAGKKIPTVGTSLGLERIIDVLEELGLMTPPRVSADVFVTVFDTSCIASSIQIAASLRKKGIKTELYLGKPGSLRKQLTYASRLGIPWVIIAGPDELANNEVTLRDMQSGEQRRLPLQDLAKYIKTLYS